MSIGGFDPEILQDFLTESGELLEQLEGDLVVLESTPTDPDLLNQVFRALHTIKGSASFLALTNLVECAHAAEGALNTARAGDVTVDAHIMDLLLQAVDVLKQQFEQIEGGEEELVKADGALIAGLTEVAEGRYQAGATAEPVAAAAESAVSAGVDSAPAGTAEPAVGDSSVGPFGARISPIELPSDKADLLEFLVADLEETLDKAQHRLDELGAEADRAAAQNELIELGDALAKNAEFFDYGSMLELARGFLGVAEHLSEVDEEVMPRLLPRLKAACVLMGEQARGLTSKQLLEWPTEKLVETLRAAAEGRDVDAETVEDALAALRADGVISGEDGGQSESGDESAEVPGDAAGSVPEPADSAPAGSEAPGTPAPQQAQQSAPQGGAKRAPAVEQTIRVEVGRLESLMNLVGELVLQKNRIGAIARDLASIEGLDQDRRELVTAVAGDLDRTTGDIQVAVMRTRMQPLDKLFGKYPRLIRDLAGKTGKKIKLEIVGGDTEVDKSVIEELGDPLVHIMRNSADHGLEKPEQREAAGKGPEGTITLAASHEGSHVRILIKDNGRGLPRDKLAAKAVERGLVTEAEVAQMTDQEVYRFIFAPGFSTADEVSDLSGRGVGMDVVRTNIEKLKGTVDVDSELGKGTVITFLIPLTVAIMPAMMVAVGPERYAVPLDNILEIVRPTAESISTVGEAPVMRLRDQVLPMIHAGEVFDLPESERGEAPFAVVVSMHDKQVALMVSKPIGQQEIVIKPLDNAGASTGPVSGATVRDDGGVSLIVDVAELIRIAEGRQVVVNAAA